ncbi:DUF551 domain-containing protein [[Haemophilus] ducreyi]|uniref:DUF551 domain-containing protein n=1 Tax=Haemophilus ducreyi TaxID=730 RepID=UPI0009C0DC50|nr:DUF551 domain-containing protein [[Haemophilus] ducreyi]
MTLMEAEKHLVERMQIKKNNNWVSVKDSLPEINPIYEFFEKTGDCLLYGLEEQDDIPHQFIGYMIRGNRFYSENGECYKVTHWQRLPKPPIK